MGPKVEAACQFVEATNKKASIGRLDDVVNLLEGGSGTMVVPAADLTTGGGTAVPA